MARSVSTLNAYNAEGRCDYEDMNSTGLFAVRAPDPLLFGPLKVKLCGVNGLWYGLQFLVGADRARTKFCENHAREIENSYED